MRATRRCGLGVATGLFLALTLPAPAQNPCPIGTTTEPRPDGNSGVLSVRGNLCPMPPLFIPGMPGVTPIVEGRSGGIKIPFEAGLPTPGAEHGKTLGPVVGVGSPPTPPAAVDLPAGTPMPQVPPGLVPGARDIFVQDTVTSLTAQTREAYRDAGRNRTPAWLPVSFEQDPWLPSGAAGWLAGDLGGQGHRRGAGVAGDDPVLPGTGEFVHERTDVALGGVGDVAFRFTRVYRSRFAYRGPLGHGWMHAYDQRLTASSDSCNNTIFEWRTGRGSVLRFEQGAGSVWRPSGGGTIRIVVGIANTREVVTKDGLRRIFDYRGVLQRIVDRNANELRFFHTVSSAAGAIEARLDRIEDALGRRIHFRYRPDGFLERIEVDGLGLWAHYRVDGEGDLRRTTLSDGTAEEYDYDTDAAREKEPVRIPTPGLAAACGQACGAAPGSCGGLCRQQAQEARQRCYGGCTDYRACENRCNQDCGSACSGPCPDGVAAVRRPVPRRLLLRTRPRTVRGSPSASPQGRVLAMQAARRVWARPLFLGYGSSQPMQGCVPDGLWDRQQEIFEECLASSPVHYTCLADYREPGDRCSEARRQCGGLSARAVPACQSFCAALDCAQACLPHRVCALYTDARSRVFIRVGGGFGTDGVHDVSASEVSFSYQGPLWTGIACKGPQCNLLPGPNTHQECNTGRCIDRCALDCPSECVRNAGLACEAQTQLACDAQCDEGCRSLAVDGCRQQCSGCFDACNRELAGVCRNVCEGTDWFGQCAADCSEACVAKNSEGGPYYGNLRDLNHNLIAIRNGAGVEYLGSPPARHPLSRIRPGYRAALRRGRIHL